MPALGNSPWLYPKVPGRDWLVRCRINEGRDTSVRRCESRLDPAWLVAQPPAANWSLIACCENFFQQRAVNE